MKNSLVAVDVEAMKTSGMVAEVVNNSLEVVGL
jgi:hypothetical protein